VGKPGVKSSLGEVGVDGRIILKSILKKTVHHTHAHTHTHTHQEGLDKYAATRPN